MTPARPIKRPDCLGYLAVLNDSVQGYTGGLLIVSPSGRPLEFHCSTPLQTTRAQEILFGPTLRPHICGELIATALLSASKLLPRAIFVQDEQLCPPAPAAHVLLLNQCNKPAKSTEDATPLAPTDELHSLGLSNLGATPCPADILSILANLTQHIALDEPFERVYEAIREAQRLGSQEGADDLAA